MSTTADMNPAIARAVEAFNEHDADGVIAEFAEDGTFLDPVQDDKLTKAEFREYTTELLEAFPDVWVEEERVIASDTETAIEAVFHATHEGEFDGIPPTGEMIAVPFVSIITVSDDGITSWRDYWDQQTFAEQLGLE